MKKPWAEKEFTDLQAHFHKGEFQQELLELLWHLRQNLMFYCNKEIWEMKDKATLKQPWRFLEDEGARADRAVRLIDVFLKKFRKKEVTDK